MSTGTNNITEVTDTAPLGKKFAENSQYAVLLLIMAGQAICVSSIVGGQVVFLAANIISLWRCFSLERPLADKVKDVACLGLTLAILAVKFL